MAIQLDTPLPADAAAPLQYAGPAVNRRSRVDPFALATHLVGWLLVLVLLHISFVFILPRFQDLFRDFGVGLPGITRQLLGIAQAEQEWSFWALMLTAALGHSFAAAWWYRRASEPQKLAYRLLMMLVLAGVLLFVVAALCLPLFTIVSSLSRPPPASPPPPAPAGGA